MERTEFQNEFQRLLAAYDNMPNLSADGVEEWFAVFREFPKEVLHIAIGDWIKGERYKPNPAKLRSRCLQIQKHREDMLAKEEAERNGTCPYCNGKGAIIIVGYGEHAGKPYDAVMSCRCWAGYDREKGRAILQQALADPKWFLDKSDDMFKFRRKAGFVNEPVDNRPAEPADYEAFERQVALF